MREKLTYYDFKEGTQGRYEVESRTKIYADEVRNKCIEKDWYTRGDNKAYGKMLDLCKDTEEVTLVILMAIAEDIYAHSNPDRWEGYDDNPLANIMYELMEDCCHTYYEFKKEDK